MDDLYSEVLWNLPDDQMYTLQHREDGVKWYDTNMFDTKQKMKVKLAGLPEHKDWRIVRVSKYPPHGIVEVVHFREAQK